MDVHSAPVMCSVTVQGDIAILAIQGKLDAVSVSKVRQEIITLPDQGHARVVLDLSGLSWLDSSGVGALVQLYKNATAKGGKVIAACLQRQPKEIFRLLRLESAITIHDTVEGALEVMASG
jgi:anti-sigma B factor antagonist